jgi:hypothetical protein
VMMLALLRIRSGIVGSSIFGSWFFKTIIPGYSISLLTKPIKTALSSKRLLRIQEYEFVKQKKSKNFSA